MCIQRRRLSSAYKRLPSSLDEHVFLATSRPTSQPRRPRPASLACSSYVRLGRRVSWARCACASVHPDKLRICRSPPPYRTTSLRSQFASFACTLPCQAPTLIQTRRCPSDVEQVQPFWTCLSRRTMRSLAVTALTTARSIPTPVAAAALGTG